VPDSRVPLVGASGAIAGILGAYAVMFPHARVRGLVFLVFYAQMTELPALWVLGFWFVTQLFSGAMSLGVTTGTGGGVAFFAHIGGFIIGVAFALIFTRFRRDPPTHEVIFWE
jgi:membrane associated rhomboid family serine protease